MPTGLCFKLKPIVKLVLTHFQSQTIMHEAELCLQRMTQGLATCRENPSTDTTAAFGPVAESFTQYTKLA